MQSHHHITKGVNYNYNQQMQRTTINFTYVCPAAT